MNTAINAIRTENQAAAVYLQQLQTCVEANKEYLSKVKIDPFVSFEREQFSIVDQRTGITSVTDRSSKAVFAISSAFKSTTFGCQLAKAENIRRKE